MEKQKDWTKWIAIGLGGIIGLSHFGMIGIIANREENGIPKISMPEVGPYTSYNVIANKEGYSVEYKGNDPKTMITTKDINVKGGFLGLGNNKTQVVQEYVMDGAFHQGGPTSNHRSWIDPSAMVGGGEKKISAKTAECIKAIGGAEQSGRLVGSSVGAAAAPSLSGIPFVGWLAAGWVTMFGGNQGAEIGGNMAKGLNDACIE
tara:strand:- start:328 stop:939 length:612 start_codon:yes stop_codon:yes gene_type:complete